MIKIFSLGEEFFDAITRLDSYYEIFINPTSKELDEVSKQTEIATYEESIRFVAIKKKKELYVWSADVLHQYMLNKIDFKYGTDKYGDYLIGIIEKREGKWVMLNSNYTEMGSLIKDWDWVNKYIDISG